MQQTIPRFSASLALAIIFFSGHLRAESQPEKASPGFERAKQLFAEGNHREALERFRTVLDNQGTSSQQKIESYQRSLQCFGKLNQGEQVDAFREALVAKHGRDWRFLAALAQSFIQQPHYGYLIAGEFRRGNHRGGGMVANVMARDRVRALQLFGQALKMVEGNLAEQATPEARRLLQEYAGAFLWSNGYRQAWRLQLLTDLSDLPEPEEGWGHRSGGAQGAAVDDTGKPVFYEIPASWKDAKSDGERWRHLLETLVRWQPERRNFVRIHRADALLAQFGVQTLANYGWRFGGPGQQPTTEDADGEKTGTFALHTLGENETIARLATGIERFELPDDQNPIKLYQLVLEDDDGSKARAGRVLRGLATIFENRRQFPRAARYWREAIQRGGPRPELQRRLDQIVKNWGRFEATMTQPAGQGATVDFRFRNGNRVEFTAQQIDVKQLILDVKTYLASNPQKLNWSQTQIENLGHRLIDQGQKKYLAEEVARWSLDLEPVQDHFDRRITVSTPLQKAGAYLLTAQMADGNKCSVILWLADTAIVQKTLAGKSLYYVADAITGRPLPDCNVEFFGFWQEHLRGKRYQLHAKKFAESTNENGLVELPIEEEDQRNQMLVVATTPEGRFAYLGFRGVWAEAYDNQHYEQVKVFSITDRPVYRTQQEVQFKFWVRHAQYDRENESDFAAKSFQVEIRDPKNEKVFSAMLTSDAYGGLEGKWQIPEGATLGQYRVLVVNHGGGTFRVEEYKKPEFEVTIDAPSKPVQLGEKVTAKISANYYFGGAVTDAKVKYKVLRTPYNETWYPPMPWDWLYGPGYGWFAENYPWYPGWERWGCFGPRPWWPGRSRSKPEVVAEREVAISSDGTVEIQIDTALALQFHPDQDHRYEIQAEVVDLSRRTIVATGQVLVARQPFRVQLWTDRGYYRVGDTMVVGCAARTLSGKPVEGTGTLRLLKIRYDDTKPVETEVGTWELATDAQGMAELQLKASEAGQYRIAYELTDAEGHAIEGGQVITITGEGFDGSEFRFNDIELVADRRGYQAGEKVALQINTNRAGAAVLLFLRPVGGVYLPPQLVRLEGKSQILEFEVLAKDTPNFFVEAVTVHGGRLHTATRELFVPPVERVLHVEVVPSSETYLPGQVATILVKLTDGQGQPFVGSLAMAVYDKALEYISGGSNVADIREFFWKWRRNHYPNDDSNLQRHNGPLTERNQPRMQNLGIFGATAVDEILGLKSLGGGGIGGGEARSLEKNRSGAPEMLSAASGLADMAQEESAEESSGTSPKIDVVQPTVRENFADTALWVGALETNAEGLAEVELTMPENLTTWKIRSWGMGHGTRVGEGSAEVITRKNIIVRLQAPRFFVERDEVVLSAIVHNDLPEAKQVRVQLALEGGSLECGEQLEEVVEIEAEGERRVDWRVRVVREGTATVRMSALADEESDAIQMQFPVFVHGMLKTESYTGVVRPLKTQSEFTVVVPAERRAEQTRLEIRYTPTLAGAMVDALPYLIDYPYGCTEQTLNRFLPAVITQQTLKRMGVDLATIREKQTNLDSQEIDSKDAERWKRFDRNPVFDDQELNTIVKAGVNRLTEMQLTDGGWGWFGGWGERSYAHTTAVVVNGLLVAQENGVALVPGVLDRGVQWLQRYEQQQIRLILNWEKRNEDNGADFRYKQFADNIDALVHMVLSRADRARGRAVSPQSEPSQADSSPSPAMRAYLYRDRTHLAVYSLATFGLALHYQSQQGQNEEEQLAMVMRNLHQYVQEDEENQTAWLNLPGGQWWHWYGSEYEAHAYFLKLLAATDPKSELAPRLVKYLLNNRKHATYWNSTRDTALVVEAFADYLQTSGEDEPDVTVEVWIDGQQRKQVSINRENLFTFDNKLVLTGDQLETGRHTVEIRKQGKSPIYYSGYLTNFTLEDDIRAAGLELKVERQFFKLSPAEKTDSVSGGHGQVVDQKVEAFDRTPLVNFAQLKSGDLVEVQLVVQSKNDYEYILMEDMKAAGFEAVDVRSGYNGNELGAYMELRDDRVSLLVTRLARGRHSISYRLRAEIPGKFSALPTRVSAMYAPELKANSDEMKLKIAD